VKRGFLLGEIADLLDIGQRLVEAHMDIVEERHPAAVTNTPHRHQQATSSNPGADYGAT
jgi:hypothetical protein